MKVKSIAPGRVCLFGDHQDYLGLPVIACAIDRQIVLEAQVNETRVFKIELPDIKGQYQIAVDDPVHNLKKRDYYASSLRRIRKYGIFPEKGYDIQISGDIPINAGLSSSSAIIVAWINFLISVSGIENFDQSKLALAAYEAEVTEHGESGGMMDQYTIALGNIQYVFQDKEFKHKQIGRSFNTMVIGESGIPKNTVGLLKEKKENALSAINTIKLQEPNFNLRMVDAEIYGIYKNKLPDKLIPYFYAAVHNHLITLQALKQFSEKEINLLELGRLMNEHHAILRDKLQLTVPLIDLMIDAALSSGAHGAKIVGSGGGGSIVALTDELHKGHVIESLLRVGAKDAYEVKTAKGARTLINNNA